MTRWFCLLLTLLMVSCATGPRKGPSPEAYQWYLLNEYQNSIYGPYHMVTGQPPTFPPRQPFPDPLLYDPLLAPLPPPFPLD